MITALLLLACDPDDTGFPAPTACESIAQELVQAWEEELVDPDEVSAELGIGGPGLAVADLTGDGWLDVVMAVPVAPSVVLVNDGTGRLAVDAGPWLDGERLPAANAVASADVDGDGRWDLVLARGTGFDDLVLRNTGAGFTSAALPASRGESYTPSFGDLDGDGDLDLFVARLSANLDTAGIQSGSLLGDPNTLYLNDFGTFSEWAGLPEASRLDFSFHGAWLDVDADGDLDLYQSNDFGAWTSPNRLLLNDGGVFTDAGTGSAGGVSGFTMGSAVGDANADGQPDLFVSDLGHTWLLLGTGAGLVESAAALGASVVADGDHLASWGSVFVDLDGDGLQEVAVAYGSLFVDTEAESFEDYVGDQGADWVDAAVQRDVLLQQGPDGFVDVSAAAGFDDGGVARAVATGDFDRDGRPDLVVAGVPYLRQYRTAGGCGAGGTLRVAGSAWGPGLQVRVVNEALDTVVLPAVSGTFSSHAPEVPIPLGGRGQADVTVSWPGGGSRTVTVRAGEVVDVAP